ncbi:MAG: leucine-rich repeat domain-containing protein, partial [Acetatifactor sp.]|nr:leucine-rich repeat domain-containing protein [Acetatifactor sp.]
FHYCTALEEITLGDGLQVIGNHAFDNCAKITKIDIPEACRLTTLGDHAFYGCQNLQSFAMPTSVRSIGDGAFEDCYAMTKIDLHDALVLNTIGDHAFRNCRSLQSLVIPEGVKDNSNYANGGKGKGNTLQLNMIEGCTALQYVTLVNPQANFAESKTPNSSTDFTFENFKAALKQPDTFYFEGVNSRMNGNGDVAPGTLHATANDNGIAFKFYGEKYAGQYDIYEIVIKEEPGSTTNNNKAIYRVASNDELIYCSIDEGMKNVVIPPAIGPAHIRTISSTSFGGNCFLEKVTIPSSVQKIEANAFRGCHHLTDVIFESPISLRAGDIGANAFKTQDVTVHQRTCTGSHQDLLSGDNLKLTFTGEISPASGPFAYAMDANNNINSGSQERTYVTFYSGWPTNLAVQYNPVTKKNELIDYPTFEDLKSGTKYTEDNYPYITKEYADAARDAVGIYMGTITSHPQTDDERAVIEAALDIKLPQGIEAVKRIYKDANDEVGRSLFAVKEANEDRVNKVITTEGIAEIPARTFEGCKNLKELYIWGATSSIGDYAFKDCNELETVEISSNVNSMGVRPFAGCPKVSYVSFQGGPNFVCSDSIIYGLNGGKKETLIECLE